MDQHFLQHLLSLFVFRSILPISQIEKHQLDWVSCQLLININQTMTACEYCNAIV
jgi:hypothetical protein